MADITELAKTQLKMTWTRAVIAVVVIVGFLLLVAVVISLAVTLVSNGDSKSADSEFTGPDELAEFLIERSSMGDWQEVRSAMPAAYQQFDLDDIVRFTNVREFQDADWHIEIEGRHATVRLTDDGLTVMVLIRDEAGVWRYDPGGYVLMALKLSAEHEGPLEMQMSPGYAQRVDSELDAMARDSIFRHSPLALAQTSAGPELTVTWTFINHATGNLFMENVYWHLGGQRGEVEVVWTTALWGAEQLGFPVPPLFERITDRRVEVPYSITFLLKDVPADWSDGLELHIDNLIVE